MDDLRRRKDIGSRPASRCSFFRPRHWCGRLRLEPPSFLPPSPPVHVSSRRHGAADGDPLSPRATSVAPPVSPLTYPQADDIRLHSPTIPVIDPSAPPDPVGRHRWFRACSSAGEHYVDIVGVTGSIPVTPTTTSSLYNLVLRSRRSVGVAHSSLTNLFAPPMPRDALERSILGEVSRRRLARAFHEPVVRPPGNPSRLRMICASPVEPNCGTFYRTMEWRRSRC